MAIGIMRKLGYTVVRGLFIVVCLVGAWLAARGWIERLPDGHSPTKDEGWRDVWAQLGGTTLSIWDMKEIDEASKQGKEVPPTYINVTDAVSRMP